MPMVIDPTTITHATPRCWTQRRMKRRRDNGGTWRGSYTIKRPSAFLERRLRQLIDHALAPFGIRSRAGIDAADFLHCPARPAILRSYDEDDPFHSFERMLERS